MLLLRVNVSAVSKTTLFPCINSSVEPCGIATFFKTFTSSADGRVIPTPTTAPEPDIFARVIPITTVVVALGTTYTVSYTHLTLPTKA